MVASAGIVDATSDAYWDEPRTQGVTPPGLRFGLSGRPMGPARGRQARADAAEVRPHPNSRIDDLLL